MKYRTIVADPPWHYDMAMKGLTSDSSGPTSGVPFPYPTMSTEEIAALPVALLAESDSTCWLWTTMRYLPVSFGILAAWGFTYKQTFVWCKTSPPPMGGSVGPSGVEFLLLGKRGHPTLQRAWPRSWIALANSGSRARHSAKPEAFTDYIEATSPGPYLELFARRNRLGWDTWGNESLEMVDL